MMDTIDFSHSEHYTLSVRLSTDGISLAVFNPLMGAGETAMAVEDRPVDEALPWAANLRQLYDDCGWLHRPFRRVNVLLADRRFTLMPLDLWEERLMETVFYHNHPWQENEQVLCNRLRSDQVALLFGIDKSVRSFLDRQHPEVRYYAQAALLIHGFSSKSRLGNTRKMFAHLRGEYMDVFCYDHGRLLLANSYKCQWAADRIYYLLYLWQALAFEQERDELHLCGLLADKDELLSGLREFIRQVFVMNPSRDMDLQAALTFDD